MGNRGTFQGLTEATGGLSEEKPQKLRRRCLWMVPKVHSQTMLTARGEGGHEMSMLLNRYHKFY